MITIIFFFFFYKKTKQRKSLNNIRAWHFMELEVLPNSVLAGREIHINLEILLNSLLSLYFTLSPDLSLDI